MASQFYIVHHHFKPGMSGPWWGVMAEADEAAQSAQAEKWMNMGYFNHCFMPLSQEGPMYCVWEAKDGNSEADFQDFIDGPDGANMGMKSLNNNIMKVNLDLTGGVPPYERKFA